MKRVMMAAGVVLALAGGDALAQAADPIAQRQEGLRGMSAITREITQTLQARGDVRPLTDRKSVV